MCGVEVEIDGKEVVSIRGDAQDVFSRGHVCPKSTALKDLYDDPDRLKQPVRRVGDRWETISWVRATPSPGGTRGMTSSTRKRRNAASPPT